MSFPNRWKYKLNIADVWQKCKEKEITIQELCKKIIERTNKLKIKDDFEIEEILENLQYLSEDTETDQNELVEEFDSIWNDFYDWADHKRVWVNIF